jgi:thiol-disulfide isomerase/thioredoxin
MLEKSKIFAARLNSPFYNKVSTLFLVKFCLALMSTSSLVVAESEWQQPELGYQLSALSKPIPAPAFNLMDMDEEHHSLEKYRDKVILLNFWATWCPPCRREMPSMESLHQSLKDENFVVIAINQMEEPDHVFAYTGQLDVDPTFLLLFDTDSKISQAYKVNGLPTTYLIDKKGLIRYRAIGGRDFNHLQVRRLIRQLLLE